MTSRLNAVRTVATNLHTLEPPNGALVVVRRNWRMVVAVQLVEEAMVVACTCKGAMRA